MGTNDAMGAVARMEAQLEKSQAQGEWLDRLLFQLVPAARDEEQLRRQLARGSASRLTVAMTSTRAYR